MPELPEVETARVVIDAGALHRRIADVDDADTWVLRPHQPGEIRSALVGRELDAVHRRGKSMWCDTSAAAEAGLDGPAGPSLGIHLGMSGKIVMVAPDGMEVDGGDYWGRGRAQGDHRFTRFAITFADGGQLLLVDPRRLGRVRLDPPVEKLGPDARGISPKDLRAVLAKGTVAVKARLLDQEKIAGVGNLLADEILWQAGISPLRPVDELAPADVQRLGKALRAAVERAVRDGGVHTLEVIPYRTKGARCPRDNALMSTGTVGGRTTWWCPQHER